MEFYTLEEFIAHNNSDPREVIYSLAQNTKHDTYLSINNDLNPKIKMLSYFPLPQDLLNELYVRLRTENINLSKGFCVDIIHSFITNKMNNESYILSMEELSNNRQIDLTKWQNERQLFYVQTDPFCMAKYYETKHPLYWAYKDIFPSEKISYKPNFFKENLTITRLDLNLKTILVRKDHELVREQALKSKQEIIYEEYPQLNPESDFYNPKIECMLNGSKKLLGVTGFGKKFEKYVEEVGYNFRSPNLVKTLSEAASPYREG